MVPVIQGEIEPGFADNSVKLDREERGEMSAISEGFAREPLGETTRVGRS